RPGAYLFVAAVHGAVLFGVPWPSAISRPPLKSIEVDVIPQGEQARAQMPAADQQTAEAKPPDPTAADSHPDTAAADTKPDMDAADTKPDTDVTAANAPSPEPSPAAREPASAETKPAEEQTVATSDAPPALAPESQDSLAPAEQRVADAALPEGQQ